MAEEGIKHYETIETIILVDFHLYSVIGDFQLVAHKHIGLASVIMKELLDALRKGDPVAINKYAMELLVTRDKRLNKLQANEFEHFAHCKVEEWPASTVFKYRCYIGTITYKNETYGFG